MSKFWQKKYTSKYSGAEIDAAVSKADTVPAVTEANFGDALVVNSAGKIVPGKVNGVVSDIMAPEAFNNAVNSCMQSIAVAVMGDYKFHNASVEITHSDTGWEDLYSFYLSLIQADFKAIIEAGTTGDTYLERMVVNNISQYCIKNYAIDTILGFGEIITIFEIIDSPDDYSKFKFTVYVRRIEEGT